MKLRLPSSRNVPLGDERHCSRCCRPHYSANGSRFGEFKCEHCGHKNEPVAFALRPRPIAVCLACLILMPIAVGIAYGLLDRPMPFGDKWFFFWGTGLLFCFWIEVRHMAMKSGW